MDGGHETCLVCAGTGKRTCTACHGSGKKPAVSGRAQAGVEREPCDRCAGSGSEKCTFCGGSGWMKKITVTPLEPRRPAPGPLASFRNVSSPDQAPSSGARLAGARVGGGQAAGGAPAVRDTFYTDLVVLCTIVVVLILLLVFSLEQLLVAGEAFCVVAGWTGLRAAEAFGKPAAGRLESFRTGLAIACGLIAGALAAYLVLTTAEGQKLIAWVAGSTLHIATSLLGSVVSFGILDFLGRKVMRAVAG